MDVYECLRKRLTVRSFKPDPVPESVTTRLLQAGRWAPSSRNQQPWHFIVIRDRDTLGKIGEAASTGSFVGRAPLAIAVVMANADSPELDAGRALQQMEVLAWSEGLGTCFVGLETADENRKVKELLGIPKEMDLITVLPFGYRAEGTEQRGKRRKPLREITHKETFGDNYLTA